MRHDPYTAPDIDGLEVAFPKELVLAPLFSIKFSLRDQYARRAVVKGSHINDIAVTSMILMSSIRSYWLDSLVCRT
jgi:hypothetical protein